MSSPPLTYLTSGMSTPVMGDHTVAFAEEVKQLVVYPIMGTERPAMMKDEGLRISRPILAVGNPFQHPRSFC